MNEPLSEDAVKRIIRERLKDGRGVYFSAHARRRMKEGDVGEIDCERILSGGFVEPSWNGERREWRYKVRAQNGDAVVVAIDDDENVVIVTVIAGRD